jgi:hypothetical protein
MISCAEIRRFFTICFPENSARVTERPAEAGPGSRLKMAEAALHALGGFGGATNMENCILKYCV